MQRLVALGLVLVVAAVLLYTTSALLPFGSFPQRKLGVFENQSVGQHILENAPTERQAANVVTAVVWDYRGYDTLGEATVLFTAVCGVIMLFAAARRG
jgi:multisubunit Na+/H+ antiporter MnhB subunit